MKLSTQSELRHHTTLLAADRDGLTELLDLVRGERSTGKLTVSFNQGGITSVTFEELKRVTQRELDNWDTLRHGESANGNGNGHLATRGAVTVVPQS